ncbi:MAG: DUF1588 domain-containing protein [Myxococcales bacterium]|nr:DUF1588 domain-containing protein [Myxococcales bacterium]
MRIEVVILVLLGACSGVIADAPGADGREPSERAPVDPSAPLVCDPTSEAPLPAGIWRLQRAALTNTLRELLGLDEVSLELAPDPVGVTFAGEVDVLRMRDDEVNAIARDAAALADRAMREGTLLRRFPCLSAPDETCRSVFVADFGRLAFRRPLTRDEQARYEALFSLAQEELGEGPQAVVEAMIQSPSLLYRSELGAAERTGIVRMTGHELAAWLSYTFTDAPPDEALAALADRDALDASTLREQVSRLAADPRWRAKKARFLRELLDVSHVATVEKDPTRFPEHAALRASFERELEALLERAFAGAEGGGADLGLLFDTREAFVDAALAEHYGVAAPPGGEGWVTLPEVRRGLLRRAAFLAVHSGVAISSPITRGYVIRTRILCDVIPDPPPGANTSLPDPEPGMSERDRIDAATGSGSCVSCHARMNDLGFAFDEFDAVGRHRDVDDLGVPLDLSGMLADTQDVDGPFDDPDALFDRLRGSRQVAECMSLQAFRFLAGRGATSGDRCTTLDMLSAAGGPDALDFDALLGAYVHTDNFAMREVTR